MSRVYWDFTTDQPDLAFDLFDADFLAGEDGAEIDLHPVEADPPAAGDDGAAVVEGVVEIGSPDDLVLEEKIRIKSMSCVRLAVYNERSVNLNPLRRQLGLLSLVAGGMFGAAAYA